MKGPRRDGQNAAQGRGSSDPLERAPTRLGARNSTQTFFCTKFFENPSGHGRPRRKSWTSAPKSAFFSAAPVMGRNFLTQGRPGVRVRNVRRKSGPKSLGLCCFFFPDRCCRGHEGTTTKLARLRESMPKSA